MKLINPGSLPVPEDILENEQCDEQCNFLYFECICKTLDLWPFD